jgi:nucleoside-diphosphate-sugar epimerase
MTTLVTGAGLIGTAYAIEAAKRGEKVVFLDPVPRADYVAARLGDADYEIIVDDVRSLPALIDAIQTHKVDTFLNTAGLIGKRVGNPLAYGFDLNIGGAMQVAEAVRLTGIKRLIHTSTFGVYDWRQPTPDKVDESFHRGAGAPYSNSKAAQELIFEAYQGQCGFELVLLRPGNVFGVGHFWAGSGGGEKVQALVEAGLRGETAVIPEEQTMAFEYIYAKDMGRAADLAATATGLPPKAVYNLAYGEVISFDRLVEAVSAAVPGFEIEITPGKAPISRDTPLDVSRAANELGWTPSFSLDDAMADYAGELRKRNR